MHSWPHAHDGTCGSEHQISRRVLFVQLLVGTSPLCWANPSSAPLAGLFWLGSLKAHAPAGRRCSTDTCGPFCFSWRVPQRAQFGSLPSDAWLAAHLSGRRTEALSASPPLPRDLAGLLGLRPPLPGLLVCSRRPRVHSSSRACGDVLTTKGGLIHHHPSFDSPSSSLSRSLVSWPGLSSAACSS